MMDALPLVRRKLRAARKLVPDVQDRIRAKQSLGDAKNGRALLKGLDDRLEETLTLVEEMLDSAPVPSEPDAPDVPAEPVPSGWQTVANRTFSGADVLAELDKKFHNRAYANCIFQDYAGESLLHGDIGQGARFNNCTFRRMKATKETHGTLLIYPGDSAGTSADDYDLQFVNCLFEDCEGSDIFEIKCSGVGLINCRFVRCTGGIRVRHGKGTEIVNCTGVADISLRCGPHTVVNCPDAVVTCYAGNLPWTGWESGHIAGGGHNMQACGRAQIANVKSVVLGFHFGDNDKQFPATECNIAPGVPVKEILHTGTTRDPVAA